MASHRIAGSGQGSAHTSATAIPVVMPTMAAADAEPTDFRLCTAPTLAAAVLFMPVVTDTAHQIHMFLIPLHQ